MLGVLDSRAQHTRVYPSRRACTGARAQCTRNATLCPPTNTPRDSDTRTSPFLPCAPSICTHLRSLSHSPPEHSGRGARGAQGRGEARRVCTHMQARTLAHTHTLPRTPGTPRRSQPPQASQGGARRHAAVADDGCPPLRPSPSRLALLSLLLPDASSTRAAPGGSSALASSRTQPLLPLPLLRLLHPLAPRYNRQTPQQRPFLEPL